MPSPNRSAKSLIRRDLHGHGLLRRVVCVKRIDRALG